MQRLIHKMLRREVWGYWFLTSHSGKFVDPDIQELRKPWADPVKKENIMVRCVVWVNPFILTCAVFWTFIAHGVALHYAFQ